MSQLPPHFPLPSLVWCSTAAPLGSAVSLVCQEEEASLDASADPLPLLTGAPLQPGGHIRRTEVLPPGSSHESQRGQENGLLSGRRIPSRQLPFHPCFSQCVLVKHLFSYGGGCQALPGKVQAGNKKQVLLRKGELAPPASDAGH